MAVTTTTRVRRATRPVPAAVEEAAPQRRIFRQSRAAPTEDMKEKAKKVIQNRLQMIAIDADRIDYLQRRIQPEIDEKYAEIERHKKVIEEQLVIAGIPGYSDGKWEALFQSQSGKSSSEFDNKKVFDALGEEKFLQCVKVQSTKISQFMNKREIADVSTLIPPEKKPDVFVVRKVEQKKDR